MKSKTNLFLTIIIVVLCIIMTKQLLERDIYGLGESPSYGLTAIALERGLTVDIIEEDFEKAKLDFPELEKSFTEKNLYKKIIKGENNVYRGYYSGTYSLAIIPMKNILKLTGVSQSYSFRITNVILFSFAIIFFINMVKIKLTNKIISVMLLVFNPILFYMQWLSAEVFIYSMLVISLSCFIKERYKSAAIFACLATTLNITLIFYEGIIVLAYLIKKYIKLPQYNFFGKMYKIIKGNWKTLIYFSALLILSVGSFFDGTLEKVNSANINLGGWVNRFLAYLFDLNLGMFSYYGIIMIILVLVLIKAFKQRQIKFLLIISAFLLIVLAYSMKIHINSGATCISRYNSWGAAFLIFALIIYITEMKPSKKMLYYCLIGATSTLIITFLYGGWMSERNDCDDFMPFARFALDKFPNMYIINEQIFSSKVLNTQLIGYENSKEPISYVSKNGYVTKILLRNEFLESLNKYITIDNDKFEEIKTNNKNNRKEYIFIDFSEKEKIKLIKDMEGIYE